MKTISRNIDETDVVLIRKIYETLGEFYNFNEPPDIETMLKGIDKRVFLNLDSIQADIIRTAEKAKKATEYAALDEAVEVEVAKKIPVKPEITDATADIAVSENLKV